jgi:hypothetical protein
MAAIIGSLTADSVISRDNTFPPTTCQSGLMGALPSPKVESGDNDPDWNIQ